MKIMKTGVLTGFFLLLFSLAFCYQSLEYPYSGPLGPGPGFFPIWLNGILLVLSLFYIYQSVKGESAEAEQMPTGKALKNIIFIVSCLIVYIVLLPFLGFLLTSTLFLFALLYREYKWQLNLGISIGVSVFLFWLFGSVLSVTLPVNGLGW